MSEAQTPDVPWKTCTKCWQKFLYAEKCATCGIKGRLGRSSKTIGGRMIWPLDPRPEEIFLTDIAHHLSRQCRFGGAVNVDLYGVGEHCVRVSYRVEELMKARGESFSRQRAAALLGLLHDAAEAYLVDLPTPVKASLHEYHIIEAKWEVAIAEKFKLETEHWPTVKIADRELLATEKRDLTTPWLGEAPPPTEPHLEPLVEGIEPWSAVLAKHRYLARYYILTDTDEE